MKICVSSSGKDTGAQVDPRFGRTAVLAFFEVEGGNIKGSKFIENPAIQAMGGAGIQAAKLVADNGATVLITGNVGPNAHQALGAAGIKIITGIGGISVEDAVRRFLSGELSETAAPTTPRPGSGMGRGGGGGMRRGGRW